MTDSWHSYPKVYALGHAALADLLLEPVIVEEKIDGSQFSFGRFDGVLRVKSKGKEMLPDAPEKMFQEGVDVARELPLRDGWTYRAEYLKKPHHGGLAYDRIPDQHLMLFDINTGHEEYLSYEQKAEEAARIGLEVVPLLRELALLTDITIFRALLECTSVLGGQKIEGVVIKNYARFGRDGKALMGKFVSEAHKETCDKAFRENNPQGKDIVEQLIERYRVPARWRKAIQHLDETGNLDRSPKDIGPLLNEVKRDTGQECEEEIKQLLWRWAWPQIQRGVTRGLPEWYKNELLKAQFSRENKEGSSV